MTRCRIWYGVSRVLHSLRGSNWLIYRFPWKKILVKFLVFIIMRIYILWHNSICLPNYTCALLFAYFVELNSRLNAPGWQVCNCVKQFTLPSQSHFQCVEFARRHIHNNDKFVCQNTIYGNFYCCQYGRLCWCMNDITLVKTIQHDLMNLANKLLLPTTATTIKLHTFADVNSKLVILGAEDFLLTSLYVHKCTL